MLNYAFCLMILNGLKGGHYFDEIAAEITKMCLEVMF